MDFKSIVKLIKWPFITVLTGLVLAVLVVFIFENVGSGGLLLLSAAVIAFVIFVARPR
jgi:hypothetical protein